MNESIRSHMKALRRIIEYIVNTPTISLFLKPTKYWDGKKGFEFVINGMSDSKYVKDESIHSVN